MSETPSENPIGKRARSLPTQVAEHIIEQILSRAIKAGDRITETALAEQHAVSRSTVREALAIVERAGLVHRIPRTGIEVLAIDATELAEIAEIRGMLLALAANRSIARPDDDAMSAFFATVKEMDRVATSPNGSADEFAALVSTAQAQLIALSGSRFLSNIYSHLNQLTLWQAVVTRPSTTFKTAKRRTESARNWGNIVSAMKKQDTPAAEAAARAILADVSKFLLEQMPS